MIYRKGCKKNVTSAQSKSIQKHIKDNYKRTSVIIKTDIYNDIIRNYGNDIKLNNYINKLIKADLKQFDPF